MLEQKTFEFFVVCFSTTLILASQSYFFTGHRVIPVAVVVVVGIGAETTFRPIYGLDNKKENQHFYLQHAH